jgi:hypothetical protein
MSIKMGTRRRMLIKLMKVKAVIGKGVEGRSLASRNF